MVDVKVQFRHTCSDATLKTWTHEFNVKKGSSLSQLRHLMVPGGTYDDAHAFELQKDRRRVRDFVQIWAETTFVFVYLGAEEGLKRAEVDRAIEAGELVTLSGRWRFFSQEQSAFYELRHEVGCDTFTGFQEGVGDLSDGRVSGTTVEWKLGDFTFKGRVEDRGFSIAELDVRGPRNTRVGVFTGTREPDASCWTVHPGFDLRGKDVESMSADDLDSVKRLVQRLRCSGFVVSQGAAYIKQFGRPLTAHDLKLSDESTACFYLYTPQDAGLGPVSACDSQEIQGTRCEKHELQPLAEADCEVRVLVKHALHKDTVSVTIRQDCTIGELKQAVMTMLADETSRVRLVKKSGKSFTSLDEAKKIGERREFLALGPHLKVGATVAASVGSKSVSASPLEDTTVATARARSPDACCTPVGEVLHVNGAPSVSDTDPAAVTGAASVIPADSVAPSDEARDAMLVGVSVPTYYDEVLADVTVAVPAGATDVTSAPPAEQGDSGELAGAIDARAAPRLPSSLEVEVAWEVQVVFSNEEDEIGMMCSSAMTVKALKEKLCNHVAGTADAVTLTIFNMVTDQDERELQNDEVLSSISPGDLRCLRVRGVDLVSVDDEPVDLELDFCVTIDAALDLTMRLRAKRGILLSAFKEMVAVMDTTGSTTAADVLLAVCGGTTVLQDTTPLTEKHSSLVLVDM